MVSRFLVTAAAPIVFILTASGCAGQRAAPLTPEVPSAVVPAKVNASGGLTIRLHSTPEVREALASVGRSSLVKEATLWEVRQGDRLVGVLELATLRARADTRKESDRRAIRQQIFPGEPEELDFSGVPAYLVKDGDRSIYLWYGRQVLGVLQLKGQIDPDAVANELIGAVLQDNRWPSLPPEDFVQP